MRVIRLKHLDALRRPIQNSLGWTCSLCTGEPLVEVEEFHYYKVPGSYDEWIAECRARHHAVDEVLKVPLLKAPDNDNEVIDRCVKFARSHRWFDPTKAA